MKKLLFAVLLICVQISAWAEAYPYTISETIVAMYDYKIGELRIQGLGAMPDYPYEYQGPSFYEAEKVIVEDGITSIGANSFSWRIHNVIKSVEIASSVTNIGVNAFAYCSNLEKVRLSEGLETIGVGAFRYDTSLREVVIPESVKSIEVEAFAWCNSLEKVTFLGNQPLGVGMWGAWDNPQALTVYVQSGVDPVPFKQAGFGNVYSLPELKVSLVDGKAKVVANLDQPYFGDVVIPAECEIDGVKYPISSIGEGAFMGCDALASIRFPECLSKIEDKAFSGCSSLSYVRFAGDRPTVGASALEGVSCTVSFPRSRKGWASTDSKWGGAESLLFEPYGAVDWMVEIAGEGFEKHGVIVRNTTKEMSGDLVIPDTCEIEGVVYPITEIGAEAFADCRGISSVRISDNIKIIGAGAFCYCSGLRKVVVGKGVELIDWDAFRGCNSLAAIRFMGNKPHVDEEWSFTFFGLLATVYYQPESEGWDDNDETWGDAECLNYIAYGTPPGSVQELGLAIEVAEGDSTITLSSDGVFADETEHIEIPAGSFVLDLNGKTLSVEELEVVGNLRVVDSSEEKTGWIEGRVRVKDGGSFVFEATRTITRADELQQILRLGRAGAGIRVRLGADIAGYNVDIYPGQRLTIDLNGRVYGCETCVGGYLKFVDSSEEKCGWINSWLHDKFWPIEGGAQVDEPYVGKIEFDLDNVVTIMDSSAVGWLGQMTRFGARVSAVLGDNIFDGLMLAEGDSLLLDLNGYKIMGYTRIMGELTIIDDDGWGLANVFENNLYMGDHGKLYYTGNVAVVDDGDSLYGGSSYALRKVIAFNSEFGSHFTACLFNDHYLEAEIPEGSQTDINLRGYSLNGSIVVNGTLNLKGVGELNAAVTFGENGKISFPKTTTVSNIGGLSEAVAKCKHWEGLTVQLSEDILSEEIEIPVGIGVIIDLNGFSLTCKTLKVLGALTLIDSKGSDGFVKADRTLLGRKGSMKIDYGPVRTTYTYLNPGLVLMVR